MALASIKEAASHQDSVSRADKKTAVFLVGYHYLSTPIYQALKAQLSSFNVYCVFPKDTIGSDTNYKHFDRRNLKATDPNFLELEYDPPWFKGIMTWHLRTKHEKVLLWLKWIWAFGPFKRKLLKLIRGLDPDVIVSASDLFFTPRYLARKLSDVPVAVIQPCYLDLWPRKHRFSLMKRLVNLLQPMVFERQQYFGFEIDRAALLVWEVSAAEIYRSRNRPVVMITNPAHLDIRDKAVEYRSREKAAILESLGLDQTRPIISLFTANYADVKGHGEEYQLELEQSLVAMIRSLGTRYSIVIKVHPNEEMKYWQKVFAGISGAHITLVHNCDRFRLMAVSDFLISSNSYAAVEATLSGCVTVNFVPGIRRIGEDFCRPFSRNAAVTCTTNDELVGVLLAPGNAATAWRDAVEQAQQRILGQSSGSRSVEDVLFELANA